jgi:hypothetical protein
MVKCQLNPSIFQAWVLLIFFQNPTVLKNQVNFKYFVCGDLNGE